MAIQYVFNVFTGNLDAIDVVSPDSQVILAQGFLTLRTVSALVTIPNDYTWIAPQLKLELTGDIQLEPTGELVIV